MKSPIKFNSIFFGFFALCVLVPFANVVFATEVTQSNSISYRPQIHTDGEKIFLVWTEKLETNAEVFFSKSEDEGVTFSKPLNISNNPGSSAFPRLVSDENNIFVTWYDYSPGQSDVMFAKSSDFGETFTSFNISDNISASYNPWIASDSDFVYLVWNDGGKSQEIEINGETRIVDVLVGDSEIMFGFSDDGGKTFEFKNISNMPEDSINARMRIADDNIFLIWTDHVTNSDIFFSKSNNADFTFSTPINISESKTKSVNSGIQIYDETIFVIWEERKDEGSSIYFSKSNDQGNSFDDPISLSGDFGTFQITRDTQMKISYPHLYVTYYEKERSEVYLVHSPDMGNTFYDPINLSTDTDDSIFPQIETDENKIFVTWSGNSGKNNDIFLRTSDDYGYTFGPKVNISNDKTDSKLFVLGPQIVKSNNFINIIFENKTDLESNLSLKQKSINDLSLSFSLLESGVQVSLEDYEIQPGEETQISIKFSELEPNDPILKNYSLVILDSDFQTVFQTPSSQIMDGYSNHTIIFPERGQYSMKIKIDDSDQFQTEEILVTVIPEFDFGILLILGASVSIVIISKKINPKIFSLAYS